MQPNPLTRFLVLFGLIFVGGVSLNYVNKMLTPVSAPAITAPEQGKSPEQEPPSDWKLTVVIFDTDGGIEDTLALMDGQRPGYAKLWPTLFECERYQDSAEFKNTLPKLKQFIEAHAPAGSTFKFSCTPVPRGRAT